MSGGPSHVDLFDPKPAPRPERGQAAAVREAEARAHPDRQLPAVAVQVRQARPVRHRGQRAVPQRRRLRRRPLRHPLDGRRQHQPQRRLPADEHRRAGVLAAEPRLVAALRPRQREPEPARLRRGQPRRSRPRAPRSGAPASCRPPTRARSSPTSTTRSPTSTIRMSRRIASGTSSTRSSGSTSCTASSARRTASSTPASRRSSWPSACRREAPEAFDVENGIAGDEAALRPRRPDDRDLRQAVPAGPAAGGARRPLRAGLPHRSRRSGRAASCGTSTAASRRSCRTTAPRPTARSPAC